MRKNWVNMSDSSILDENIFVCIHLNLFYANKIEMKLTLFLYNYSLFLRKRAYTPVTSVYIIFTLTNQTISPTVSINAITSGWYWEGSEMTWELRICRWWKEKVKEINNESWIELFNTIYCCIDLILYIIFCTKNKHILSFNSLVMS